MKSFLYKIYTYSIFDDLVFIYPLYAVMFLDFGLTAIQISIILTVWSATAFILEVPSGVLADKYSRKNILFLAQLSRIIGFAIWILFPTFIGFLIGFILWGIKSAFTSGTFEALVYDELKKFGRESEYTKIIGREKSISFVGFTIAGIGASFAIHYGYQFVLIISIISLAISAIAILLIPKAKAVESTGERKYFEVLKEGLRQSVKNISILKLIIFISLVQALFGALDEYWSIFANDVGLPKAGLGIFFTVFGAVQALASFIAYKFENHSDKFFYGLFAVNGLLLVTASYLFNVPSLILLLVFSLFFKLIDVVMQAKLQYSIDSATRATVSSVLGFFVELGVILLNLTFGFLARTNEYQFAFLTIGWVIVVLGVFYLIFIRKGNVVVVDTDKLPVG